MINAPAALTMNSSQPCVSVAKIALEGERTVERGRGNRQGSQQDARESGKRVCVDDRRSS